MHDDPARPLRERLADWLGHLAHVLPAQAPLRDFVHHNTLHGFQHLPFPEALAAARALTGAAPYWPEARFRALHAAGRIDLDDLQAALRDTLGEVADAPVVGELRQIDVLLADLRADAVPDASRRAWLCREGQVDDALLARCRQLTVSPPIPADDWPTLAARRGEALFAALGRDRTLGALLEHLGSPPLFDSVRGALQRQLAAHLDLGFAAWRHPGRAGGLYAAWRQSAALDASWDLDELAGAHNEVAWLPEDPLDAIAEALPQLLPDPARWYGYLQRLALELPGWSGMLLRRAGDRPDQRTGGPAGGSDTRAGNDDAPPVAMEDYLAIRLTLERLLCAEHIRRLSGGRLDVGELQAWLAARPAELLVRDAVGRGDLPEALAHRARHLVASPPADPDVWREPAEALTAHAADDDSAAWRLMHLLARLPPGLGNDLDAAGAARLLAVADQLDELQRGHVWLLAYERHYREQLFAALVANHRRPAPPVTAQAVFCMDDREEGTRRHLEEIAPGIRTYGAAGFFGIAMYWQGLDDAAPSALCPVVVTPQHLVRETPAEGAEAAARRRRLGLAGWRERRFARHAQTRLAPLRGPLLSTLAAPGALFGLLAASLAPDWFARLQQRWRTLLAEPVRTRLALDAGPSGAEATGHAATAPATSPPSLPNTPLTAPPDESPTVAQPTAAQPGFTLEEQVDRVQAFLRTIGLTDEFAPLVLLLGHGSDSRNNPHRSAYACGACSGRHGGPNARAFAALANRPEVRAGLVERGLTIPPGTWFVAAEHNTADDGIAWYDLDDVPAGHQDALDRLVGQLAEACRAHAAERCRRLASAPSEPTPWQAWQHVHNRTQDYGEARPELGHATNAAALIGRREMSRGLFLDRRIFLISYDPTGDAGGDIAEAILLAAGPVGAGINLEYYFSTVDNERFGCGSKITHNVTGLFGVMSGADSDLRTGLPLQMVEIHEPMRLLVVVEQTPAVLDAILARQPALQELVDNAWIVLAACEPSTVKLHLYSPAHGWQAWSGGGALPQVARSHDWYAGEREALAPALLLGGAPT